ncbi:MAG: MBOAT family O-acyltransferase [Planctomycetota bacterium]
MYFQSPEFLVFLAVVLPLFWMLAGRRRARTILLLVASYFFYGLYEWWYLSLIVFSTALDWVCGNRIHEAAQRDDARAKKRWLVASLVGNLGVLCFFKYTDWLLENVDWVLHAIGSQVDLIAWRSAHYPSFLTAGAGSELMPSAIGRMVVPVGISFFTFQTLSYTIDVYRGRLAPAKTFTDFALFVALFPQLVAGPIVRAVQFVPQLDLLPRMDTQRLKDALYRFGSGLVRKVAIADTIGVMVVDPVFGDPGQFSPLVHLIACFAFLAQIYNDFAGYSEMAIGVAKLFGFDLPENFDHPYRITSVSEFWSRWHITLSSWLRDYLYIPLGGNRTGHTVRNLFVTMILVGLWHGASWLWVLYGSLMATTMVIELRVASARKMRAAARGETIVDPPREGRPLTLANGVAHLYAITFVAITSLCIRAGTWDTFWAMLTDFGDSGLTRLAALGLWILLATHVIVYLPRRVLGGTEALILRLPVFALSILLGVAIAIAAVLLVGNQPFIYFQF